MSKKLGVLGVCAAQGALLFPFLNSNRFSILGNIEPRGVFHTKEEEQWKLNFGNIPFEKGLDSLQTVKPFAIVGSPSCGHSSMFSYSRKKTLGEPKSDPTLNLFIHSLMFYQPEVFLMENLPKLLDLIPLPEWQEKLNNYELVVHTHSVMEFGNSQKSRKRLMLIGVKKDSRVTKEAFNKVFKVATPLNTRQIKKLVRKDLNFREDDDKKLAMYHPDDPSRATLTAGQVRKLWRTEFKDEFKWPVRRARMKTLPGVYRNRKDTWPLTLRPANRQFNYGGRIIGLEEFRIIMGFPENFRVYYDKTKKNYWLNKGRVTLSKGACYEIGLWFLKCLDRI